jgi:hypothetical protein
MLNITNNDVYLNRIPEMTGKETSTAKRMRKSRNSKKMLENCNNVTAMLQPVTKCYTELEKEKELEKELEKDVEGEYAPHEFNFFVIPSDVEEIIKFCDLYEIDKSEAKKFFEYYATQNWRKSNGQKVSRWDMLYRAWIEREPKFNKLENKQGDVNAKPKSDYQKRIEYKYDPERYERRKKELEEQFANRERNKCT